MPAQKYKKDAYFLTPSKIAGLFLRKEFDV